MKRYFLIIISLIVLSTTYAFQFSSDSSACNSPEFHQFDFWIGSWNIHQKIIQKDGTWLETKAATSVSPILDGCALEEQWNGNVKFFWQGMDSVENIKGFSLRYFDPRTKNWNIFWMDNKSMNFGNSFIGEFNNGKGEFFSERDTPGGKQISRITFSDIKSNSVHWELAVSNDTKNSWTPIWIMEMTRQ